jgi:hypothetical protein
MPVAPEAERSRRRLREVVTAVPEKHQARRGEIDPCATKIVAPRPRGAAGKRPPGVAPQLAAVVLEQAQPPPDVVEMLGPVKSSVRR